MEDFTRLSEVYDVFFSKVTDDLYMELTYEDTVKMVKELLDSALPWFEFPRVSLIYSEHEIKSVDEETGEETTETFLAFDNKLSEEEIGVIATYMVVEWLGQQLASVELTRMKYSSADFKFTSQANHMQKLIQQKKEYERTGFHLQRLYKRRKKDNKGIPRSTFGEIMSLSARTENGGRKHGFHKI